jgi:hypothetical protein
MATIREVHELLQLVQLTEQAVHTIIGEWAKTESLEKDRKVVESAQSPLPSHELFNAKRTLISTTGKFVELVASPSERLLEVSSQYNEARCLHIVASSRIADILDTNSESGVAVEELSAQTGIQAQKLGEYVNQWQDTQANRNKARVMRCLCSIHIFKEVKDSVFANNSVSAALVRNEPLRAYIVMLQVAPIARNEPATHVTQLLGSLQRIRCSSANAA